jgi:uncharacterized membrane protein YraQ (UPF0718 family)
MGTTLVLYLAAFSALAVSFGKSREKTLLALKKAWKSVEGILPQLLSVFLIIGITLSILSPEQITLLLGSGSGWWGVMIAAIVGSVTLVPAFVAFPLAPPCSRAAPGTCRSPLSYPPLPW